MQLQLQDLLPTKWLLFTFLVAYKTDRLLLLQKGLGYLLNKILQLLQRFKEMSNDPFYNKNLQYFQLFSIPFEMLSKCHIIPPVAA